MEHRVDALASLVVEVLQQLQHHAAERDDGDDVEDGQQASHGVAERPHEWDGAERAEDDKPDDNNAEDVEQIWIR